MEKIELWDRDARIEHRAYGDFEQLLEDVVEKINEIVDWIEEYNKRARG